MNTQVISVRTTDDQELVADTVRKYDLLSIPVVDHEDRLVGIITVDDIVDVIEEENTEDFEKMAAMLPSDDEYLKTSVVTLAKNRLPWLLILMISATFTGMIITHFENVLSSAASIGVALMSCIPMLMDTGGNCGSQASTLAIRGLALGEIEPKDLWKVLWKEVRVALMRGLRAGAGQLRCASGSLTPYDRGVAFVVSIAMFFTDHHRQGHRRDAAAAGQVHPSRPGADGQPHHHHAGGRRVADHSVHCRHGGVPSPRSMKKRPRRRCGGSIPPPARAF